MSDSKLLGKRAEISTGPYAGRWGIITGYEDKLYTIEDGTVDETAQKFSRGEFIVRRGSTKPRDYLTPYEVKDLYLCMNAILEAFKYVQTSGGWEAAVQKTPIFLKTFEKTINSARKLVSTLPDVAKLKG